MPITSPAPGNGLRTRLLRPTTSNLPHRQPPRTQHTEEEEVPVVWLLNDAGPPPLTSRAKITVPLRLILSKCVISSYSPYQIGSECSIMPDTCPGRDFD